MYLHVGTAVALIYFEHLATCLAHPHTPKTPTPARRPHPFLSIDTRHMRVCTGTNIIFDEETGDLRGVGEWVSGWVVLANSFCIE